MITTKKTQRNKKEKQKKNNKNRLCNMQTCIFLVLIPGNENSSMKFAAMYTKTYLKTKNNSIFMYE